MIMTLHLLDPEIGVMLMSRVSSRRHRNDG